MSARWTRRKPSGSDTATAAVLSAVLAIGVGTIVFYLTRTLLAREELSDRERKLLDVPRS